jgi:hypothetical protein
VFDGALDQLVHSALSLRQPTADELARLETLLSEAKAASQPGKRGKADGGRPKP